MSQDAILQWLEKRGIKTTPADPAIIAEYERSMREETIPAIIAEQKLQGRLRACMIYHSHGCQCCKEKTDDI